MQYSITAFGTDGFSLGSSGAGNTSTQTYMYACWKANGGTTSTNTSGTITSTVQIKMLVFQSLSIQQQEQMVLWVMDYQCPEFVISMKDGGQAHYTFAGINGLCRDILRCLVMQIIQKSLWWNKSKFNNCWCFKCKCNYGHILSLLLAWSSRFF